MYVIYFFKYLIIFLFTQPQQNKFNKENPKHLQQFFKLSSHSPIKFEL